MANRYAYVQNGVVLDIEKRTENDTDTYPIAKYYHGALLPFFIEIQKGINSPADREVSKGWLFTENQFHEPQPFEINQETGDMYLPPNIPAETFWQVYQDNIRLQNENLQLNQSITDLQLALVEVYERGAV